MYTCVCIIHLPIHTHTELHTHSSNVDVFSHNGKKSLPHFAGDERNYNGLKRYPALHKRHVGKIMSTGATESNMWEIIKRKSLIWKRNKLLCVVAQQASPRRHTRESPRLTLTHHIEHRRVYVVVCVGVCWCVSVCVRAARVDVWRHLFRVVNDFFLL